jgi:hypothetical protein
MKTFFTILLATLCAATSYGQTMKALSYNASNGVVAYSNTNDLQLPSSLRFGTNTRIISSILQFDDQDRISLEEARFVGDWTFAGTITFEAAASVRTNLGLGAAWLTNGNVTNFRTAIGLGATNDVAFNSVNVTNAAATRTNIGLPLPALTNTSNVTAMRALSGSTNTNHPFSGSISVIGTNNTNTLVFSNGILQSVQ